MKNPEEIVMFWRNFYISVQKFLYVQVYFSKELILDQQ